MNQAFSILDVLWSGDPATQSAIGLILGLALVVALAVYLPLIIRLFRLYSVERGLRALNQSESSTAATVEDFEHLIEGSPIEDSFEEFERRWKNSRVAESVERSPIRLLDIFEERPLLPFGPRRSILPVLPGLFLAVGIFSALSGLIPSLNENTTQGMNEAARSAFIAGQLGIALRAAAWGFLCAVGASLTGRLIEGAFDARSHGLDDAIEFAFGSVSPGELAEMTRVNQELSLTNLGRDLSNFNSEMNDRLDRGLQRIEQSSARAASLVSQEQRGALNTVVQELSLSIRQGVDQHLSELRAALSRAVEHQSSVTGALAETFEQMVTNANQQDQIARALNDSVGSIQEASQSLRGAAIEIQPVVDNLKSANASLEKTAEHINESQVVVGQTAESIRTSLDAANGGANAERQLIEATLAEVQRTVSGLETGLGQTVSTSIQEINDSLTRTVGLFKDTLTESNETIERLTSPIRATETSSRDTHLALDRVRGEIEALGQWMSQVAKPIRGSLTDVEARAEEIARSLADFNGNTRQIDKTMEALRHEIREESRRLQGTSSDLGRRLHQTTTAVEMLDSLALRGEGRAEPRGLHASVDQSTNGTAPTPSADSPPPESFPEYRPDYATGATGATGISDAAQAADTSEPQAATQPMRGLPSAPPAPSDLSFRVSTPRANGPDPYTRFDPPANGAGAGADVDVQAAAPPVVENAFGDDLKLSELLRGRKNHQPKRNGRKGGKNRDRAAKQPATVPDGE